MTVAIIVLGIIAVVAIVAGLLVWLTQQDDKRRKEVREKFGPEYHELRSRYGDSYRADRELEARQRRVDSYDLRPIPATEARRYADEWRETQSRFVDDPSTAIGEADALVTEAMRASGYPVGDFEQQSTDVSVDHAGVVQDYRSAHEISERNARGDADTESLRQAMVHYRRIFEELLEPEMAGQRR
jgi:hypothetical protein